MFAPGTAKPTPPDARLGPGRRGCRAERPAPRLARAGQVRGPRQRRSRRSPAPCSGPGRPPPPPCRCAASSRPCARWATGRSPTSRTGTRPRWRRATSRRCWRCSPTMPPGPCRRRRCIHADVHNGPLSRQGPALVPNAPLASRVPGPKAHFGPLGAPDLLVERRDVKCERSHVNGRIESRSASASASRLLHSRDARASRRETGARGLRARDEQKVA